MTQKQLDEAKKACREMPEDKRKEERTKLFCIDMINSILCYNANIKTDTPEEVLQREENKKYNYLAEYVQTLGRSAVLALIAEQMNDIKEIKNAVFEDDEGILYNSIIWKD